jgi:hypothetical protein
MQKAAIEYVLRSASSIFAYPNIIIGNNKNLPSKIQSQPVPPQYQAQALPKATSKICSTSTLTVQRLRLCRSNLQVAHPVLKALLVHHSVLRARLLACNNLPTTWMISWGYLGTVERSLLQRLMT